MRDSANYLLKAEKICKSFGEVHALVDFDFEIHSGEIRGLIGENGSGKSTFSSIVAGMQKCDSGKMFLCGKPYCPGNAIDAMENGISMVVQEQGTISKISISANIFFGKEQMFSKVGILNVKKMNSEAKKTMESIGVTGIEPSELIDTLSFEERKLVELARALYIQPKIWIIDETTTALSMYGRDILYRMMRRLCDKGGAVIFISHDIDEIMRMCDSITVLRDGILTANLFKPNFSADSIRNLMIGREMSDHYYRKDGDEKTSNKIVLKMQEVTAADIKDVSFDLHRGEILGIGGLSNCGIHTLGKVIFGLIKPIKGKVLKDGKDVVKNPAWAVKHSMAYVSKNRDSESMMLVCSIKDNICLPALKNLSKLNLVFSNKQDLYAKKWAKKMEVKADSVENFCNTLSGGNKQKVVLAKWLGKSPEILILDCPTRGIDVGVKAEIYKLIEELKQEGRSIILISEELSELIGMSDRVLLFKDGKISGEFFRKDSLTEEKLIQKMI